MTMRCMLSSIAVCALTIVAKASASNITIGNDTNESADIVTSDRELITSPNTTSDDSNSWTNYITNPSPSTDQTVTNEEPRNRQPPPTTVDLSANRFIIILDSNDSLDNATSDEELIASSNTTTSDVINWWTSYITNPSSSTRMTDRTVTTEEPRKKPPPTVDPNSNTYRLIVIMILYVTVPFIGVLTCLFLLWCIYVLVDCKERRPRRRRRQITEEIGSSDGSYVEAGDLTIDTKYHSYKPRGILKKTSFRPTTPDDKYWSGSGTGSASTM